MLQILFIYLLLDYFEVCFQLFFMNMRFDEKCETLCAHQYILGSTTFTMKIHISTSLLFCIAISQQIIIEKFRLVFNNLNLFRQLSYYDVTACFFSRWHE